MHGMFCVCKKKFHRVLTNLTTIKANIQRIYETNMSALLTELLFIAYIVLKPFFASKFCFGTPYSDCKIFGTPYSDCKMSGKKTKCIFYQINSI